MKTQINNSLTAVLLLGIEIKTLQGRDGRLFIKTDLNFIKQSTKQCFMISDGVIQNSGKTKDILNHSNIEKLYKLDSLPDWVL